MKNKKNVKILIMGSGPTGLGAGWRLKELKEKEFLILERNSYPGGLSFTLKDKYGFLWDFGGHVLFSHYKYFDKVYDEVMKHDYYSHVRESYVVYSKGKWVPYPFQYNVHHLKDKKVLYKIADDVINNSYKDIRPSNFREWILHIFGEAIGEIFMFPYNFKVWATPPELMDFKWIGERVATVNNRTLLESIILKKDHVSWGPNNTFRFPKHGGNMELWRRIAQKLKQHIIYKTEIKKVNLKEKYIETNNGRFYYQYLISTMPLDIFFSISNASKGLKQKATRLKHTKVHIIGIGLRQPMPTNLKNKCWFYFPTSNTSIYRATIFSNYSPHNVPDIKKYWSIMTEVSESEYKKIEDNLKQKVVNGLIKLGFIRNKKQIHHITHFSKEYAYPVPTLKRDGVLNILQLYLRKYNIFSRGRFGGWKYEVGNMDHSFMQGVEVVDKILFNRPEITYFSPSYVNSKKFKETQL